MIYCFPGPDDPVRQGDIYFGLPRCDFSLDQMQLVENTSLAAPVPLEEATAGGETELGMVVGARIVQGIIITQDCDAGREDLVTLCEIGPLEEVMGMKLKEDKDWGKNLVKQSQRNLKFFYLPPDPTLGFTNRSAVDFRVTFTVKRSELAMRPHLRRGRLNEEAYQHFRERLAEFFRRYPVDEWYPLTRDEFANYRGKDHTIQPRPWQRAAPDPVD